MSIRSITSNLTTLSIKSKNTKPDQKIQNLPDVLLQKIFIQLLDHAPEFAAIRSTCKHWNDLGGSGQTLLIFLRAVSPIFQDARVSTIPPLIRYKFYTTCFIEAPHLPFADEVAERGHRNLFVVETGDMNSVERCHFKKLLEFSNHLEAGKGSEKISINSFPFFETYDRHTGKLRQQQKSALRSSKYSLVVSAKKLVSAFASVFVSTPQKEVTRLENFHSSLERTAVSKDYPSNAYGSDKILYCVYEKMWELLDKNADGRNSFLEREGCLSTGVQKADAVRSYVLTKLEVFAIPFDPCSFVTHTCSKWGTEVYREMYKIVKDQEPPIRIRPDLGDLGKYAFHRQAGQEYNVTDDQRWLAIKRAWSEGPGGHPRDYDPRQAYPIGSDHTHRISFKP